jgi:hypothetical protein
MIAELLRRPDAALARCRDRDRQRAVARAALPIIVVGGALFGAALGTFRGEAQIAFSAAKIPLATLATLALSGPGFVALASAFGRRWSLRETLALTLAAGARSSLVLFALAPVLWLAVDLGAGYHLVRLAAVAAYGLAGLSGLVLLLRGLGQAPGRAAAALGFVALFLVAGAQTAWLLRPFLGDPSDARPPLLAQGRQEGGVIGVIERSAAADLWR